MIRRAYGGVCGRRIVSTTTACSAGGVHVCVGGVSLHSRRFFLLANLFNKEASQGGGQAQQPQQGQAKDPTQIIEDARQSIEERDMLAAEKAKYAGTEVELTEEVAKAKLQKRPKGTKQRFQFTMKELAPLVRMVFEEHHAEDRGTAQAVAKKKAERISKEKKKKELLEGAGDAMAPVDSSSCSEKSAEQRHKLQLARQEVWWLAQWAWDNYSDGGRAPEQALKELQRAVLLYVDLHKPLAYIMGTQPFIDCEIRVLPPLLCPRPETEHWTHWLLTEHLQKYDPDGPTSSTTSSKSSHQQFRNKRIRVLDMCCGTGCIGVALAAAQRNIDVVALDILPEAVECANANARAHGLGPDRYNAYQSDMFSTLIDSGEWKKGASSGKNSTSDGDDDSHLFDLIVSNPPYILPQQYDELPRAVRAWETKTALVGDPQREDRQHTYFQELSVVGPKFLKKHEHDDHRKQGSTTTAGGSTTTSAGSGRNVGVLCPALVVEVGLQGHTVASVLDRTPHWADVALHADYGGEPRWVTALYQPSG